MTIKSQRLLARAKKIANKGNIEEARKLYTIVLKASPNNQEAIKELKVLQKGKKNSKNKIELRVQINSVMELYSNGQIKEALASLKTLAVDYPDEPLLCNISGVCYKAIGEMDAAVKSFEKAIAIKPDYTEVYYNLGITFKELGQLDAAVQSYKKALAINPTYAEVHNNLGNVLRILGQNIKGSNRPKYLRIMDTAIDHLEWAIAYKPNFAEAYYNLGVVLADKGQLDAALKNCEKTVALKPDWAEAHNNLAVTLHDLGQLDAAMKSYEKAIEIQPNYAEPYAYLGNALKELGQLDEAMKSYEKAITVKPDYAEAHRFLSFIKRYSTSDLQVTKMQSLFSTSDLSESDRMHLCFALAKVNEDLDNQNELFKFLHEGNRLRKKILNYSLEKDQKTYSIYTKLFSSPPSDIKKSLSHYPSTIRPIFIVGMPRSGTTLVEQIIASHNAVHGAGELGTLTDILNSILKEYLAHSMNGLPKKAFLSIRKQYLDSLSRFNVPENIITDKMPLNFRNIGFILSAMPEAKIVHLKRDARATCWSIYKNYFHSKGNGFSYNQEDLAGFYALYTELMAFWHQLFPGKIYDICYEDLTTNQEEETKNLLKYCELEWDESCLNFHNSKRAVKTASSLQVRQKMYQGSSEAWKKHEAYLKPLIKALSSYKSANIS